VSRTDDRVGVEKSTATQVTQPGKLNADDGWEIALGSGYATNDVCGVLVPVVWNFLRDSRTIDDGRNRKGGEDRSGVHVADCGKRKRETGGSLSCRDKRLTGLYRLAGPPFLYS
jgi:hypothetical protein